ncbi:MAG: hypothetical protein K9K88_18825 [Desulfobacterales bacterium]|nr:hypothetical protein [Desulfobacterales bacterium]
MKAFQWMITAAAVAALIACGGGKYSEVEQVLSDEIDVMETFVDRMENAGDADAVASALRGYADGMGKLVPKMKQLAENFPEIQARRDLPPELEKKLSQVDQLGTRMQGAMMKTMRYMQSPEVQKAMENYGRVMSQQGA